MTWIIDFCIPVLILGLGLALTAHAMAKYRRKPKPLCLACGYDLRVNQHLTCHECGYVHANERQLQHGKVRRVRLGLGGMLIAAGTLPLLACGVTLSGKYWMLWEAKATDRRVEPWLRPAGYRGIHFSEYSPVTVWAAQKMGFEVNDYFLRALTANGGGSEWRRQVVDATSLIFNPFCHYSRVGTVIGTSAYQGREEVEKMTAEGTTHVLELASGNSRLESMTLSRRWMVDERGMAQIARMKRLQRLHLGNLDVSAQGLTRLGDLEELKVVKLAMQRPVTDADLRPFCGFRNLEELFILGQGLGEVKSRTLAGFRGTKLITLCLKAPVMVEDDVAPFEGLAGVGMHLALKLPDVDARQMVWFERRWFWELELDLSGNVLMDDAGMKWVEMMPRVPKTLSIVGNGKMTCAPMTALLNKWPLHPQAPAYPYAERRRLELTGFRVDEAFLKAVAGSEVNELILTRCEMPPGGIDILAQSQRLRRLGLCGKAPGMEEIEALKRGRRIEVLELVDVPLTQELMREVGTIPGLQRVIVSWMTDPMLLWLVGWNGVTVSVLRNETTAVGRAAVSNVALGETEDAGGY